MWDASYKPFGEVQASTGGTLNLRFPGQWFSDESNLNQNWMRDYDPTLGRYIQADPLGLVDGASVYGYARQSPNRYVDPRGEDACYTDSKTGEKICMKSSNTYCPSGDCSTYGEEMNNPKYHEYYKSCNLTQEDINICIEFAAAIAPLAGKVPALSTIPVCLPILKKRRYHEKSIEAGRK